LGSTRRSHRRSELSRAATVIEGERGGRVLPLEVNPQEPPPLPGLARPLPPLWIRAPRGHHYRSHLAGSDAEARSPPRSALLTRLDMRHRPSLEVAAGRSPPPPPCAHRWSLLPATRPAISEERRKGGGVDLGVWRGEKEGVCAVCVGLAART
jgi:hypothetical protein